MEHLTTSPVARGLGRTSYEPLSEEPDSPSTPYARRSRRPELEKSVSSIPAGAGGQTPGIDCGVASAHPTPRVDRAMSRESVVDVAHGAGQAECERPGKPAYSWRNPPGAPRGKPSVPWSTIAHRGRVASDAKASAATSSPGLSATPKGGQGTGGTFIGVRSTVAWPRWDGFRVWPPPPKGQRGCCPVAGGGGSVWARCCTSGSAV